MRSPANIRLATWSIWLIPLLWTVNNLLARLAPGVVEPYTLGLMRWGFGGLILLGLVHGELYRERQHLRRCWHHYAVLGFLGMVACGAWIYIGGRTTSATNIGLIYAVSPVLIALCSAAWLRERMDGLQWLGVALALGGVLHVVVQGHWMSLSTFRFVEGDLWIIAGVVCWALYALLLEIWPSPLGPAARLAAMAWGAVPMLMVGAAWELAQPDTPPLGVQALLIGLTAAVVPGVLAFGLYSWAQQVLGASKVAATLYLGPLYGAVAGWALLGEALDWYHLWGGVVLLAGVYLVSRPAVHPPTPVTVIG